MRFLLWLFLCLTLVTSKYVYSQDCLDDFIVNEVFQETPMWCWAATIQTVIDYHYPGSGVEQCEIVESYFQIDDCYEASFSGGIMSNMRGFFEDNDLGYNFSSSYRRGPLNVNEIIDNILNCKPIIIEIRTSPFSNSSHAIVINGILEKYDINGNRYIEIVIRDPYPYSWNSLLTAGFSGIEYYRLRSIWVSTLWEIEPY